MNPLNHSLLVPLVATGQEQEHPSPTCPPRGKGVRLQGKVQGLIVSSLLLWLNEKITMGKE